jgi:hypothetical protein
MTDRTRRESTMKRIVITLGIAAALGVAPSAALGGNNTAQVESQVVEQQLARQVVRQVVRPGLVESAIVRPALVKPALLKSQTASAARVAQIRALLR